MHFTNHLSSYVHVNSVILAVNQRFYWMKLLHAQGMNYFGLSVVFNALMLSTVLYVSHQAFGGHLHVDELNSLLHSLDKAFKWGFTSVKYDIRELFELTDDKFCKYLSCNAEHC